MTHDSTCDVALDYVLFLQSGGEKQYTAVHTHTHTQRYLWRAHLFRKHMYVSTMG